MFEGFLTVPLHFTVEFLGFLVTAGGAALVLSRTNLVPGPSANRIAAALGLLSLAAAQVLHGGSFYPTDGDEILVAIRALGYALLLIGIVGDLKPAATTAALWGYEVKEPLLFAPAGAVFLVALAAIPTARRKETGFYGRLVIAGLLLAVSEVLTAAAPEAEFGGGGSDRFALAAHGIKFVGYLFLGGWMWTAVRSSIRIRFVASFGALLVAVILALSTALTGVIANNVQSEELRRVATQAGNSAEEYSFGGDRVSSLSNQAVTLATRFPEIGNSLAAGSRPARRRARELLRKGLVDEQVDFVILDPARATPGAAGDGPQLFRKSGEPRPKRLRPVDVVSIAGTEVVKEVGVGSIRASASPQIIDGRHAAVLAAHAVDQGGREVGVLILGQWIDALTVESISTSAADADVSLFVRTRLEASLLSENQPDDLRLDATTLTTLQETPGISRQQTLGATAFYNGFGAITDGRGQPVATVVISNPSSLVASTRDSVTRILFLAAMLVGVVALGLAYVSGRRITRPIQVLTATAGAVREGDLSARAEVEGDDEVGQLGATFNEMTASLVKFTDDLRKAARQEHDLRERIETIINSMADGLVAVDADLKVLAFNPEAENMTGVSTEEAIGAPVEKIVRAIDPQGEKISLPIFSLSEGTVTDVFIKPRVGDRIPVAIASAVLLGEEEGEITGGVAVIRNMTREREVERMKTEFLSNISHELRTPLTPIKGYAEILGRKEVPYEKVRQFVGGILESTGRLERIVELLVDFSAMEAGRLAPRAGQVDIREMLTSLAERWDARNANHDVATELPDDQELQVVGDERLLRRSLEEILDNAIKFSPQGGPIRLAARRTVSPNGRSDVPMVEISVTDLGIGIAESELPSIFSDFHQLDGSETRTYGGLGLGLAFVQRVIAAHQGALSVESQVDAGSRFAITIPAVAPEDGVAEKPPEAEKAEQKGGKRRSKASPEVTKG